VCAHALDFDDSLTTLRGHPSATMLPAALAVGDLVGASGADVLAAYALGLEVAGKLGRAMGHGHYLRGWHSTATIGLFSSTAAAARLWGLEASALCRAWGLAASQIGGLIRNFGTMTSRSAGTRRCNCNRWMARAGFTADGAFSTARTACSPPIAATMACRSPEPAPRQAVGDTQPGIYVKRWPCCFCNHRPIGMLELIARHRHTCRRVRRSRSGFPPGSDTAE
jgi:2-methylcitrate dehydratase PrpD